MPCDEPPAPASLEGSAKSIRPTDVPAGQRDPAAGLDARRRRRRAPGPPRPVGDECDALTHVVLHMARCVSPIEDIAVAICRPAGTAPRLQRVIALTDLVQHLRRVGASTALELAHGPFEVGSVVVHQGSLWHAEVPGASGDDAWSLLKAVPTLAAHTKDLASSSVPKKSITNADTALGEARVDQGTAREIEAARANRVILLGAGEAAKAPAAQVSQLSLPPAPIPAGAADSSVVLDDASQQAYEELFRTGTQAYLKHDFATALESFTACAHLRPGDKRVLHNLERLKQRMHPEGG